MVESLKRVGKDVGRNSAGLGKPVGGLEGDVDPQRQCAYPFRAAKRALRKKACPAALPNWGVLAAR